MSYIRSHCGHIEGIGKWKPEYDELFWYITYDGEVDSGYWSNNRHEEPLYNSGRVFKTEEQAQEVCKRIKEVLIAYQNSL